MTNLDELLIFGLEKLALHILVLALCELEIIAFFDDMLLVCTAARVFSLLYHIRDAFWGCSR